ncbi:MAG: EamA family transporter, partial [Carbonactinosporaceae bacterium]
MGLSLAACFASYGLLRKRADVGTAEGLAVETTVLFLPALGFLTLLEVQETGTFGHLPLPHSALLVVAGVVTAVPLLFFGAAATRVPLSVIGMLQYLTPSMQFLIGVLLYREPMPPERLVGFAIVWAALVVLSVDGLRRAGGSAPGRR